MANVCPGAEGTLGSSVPTSPARSRGHLVLLDTWMELHREPQGRLEKEAELPKLQSLSLPSHLRAPHSSAQRQGPSLAQRGASRGDNPDYLVLPGKAGGFQHLGCRRGTGGKVGLAAVTECTAKPYRGDKRAWSTSAKGTGREGCCSQLPQCCHQEG